MYSKIKRLRRHGARLSDDEIGRDPGVAGELRGNLYRESGEMHIGVFESGNPLMRRLCPDLLNPRVTAVGANRMLLEGMELQMLDNRQAIVSQEWSIEWLGHPGK